MSTARFPVQMDRNLDAEAADTVVEAFNEAWSALQSQGIVFSRHADVVETRELLARRIVKTARCGERDRNKLRQAALIGLIRSTLPPSPRFG